MFGYWSDDFTRPLRRVVDPPQPVLVDLSIALPAAGAFRRDSVSMRVKAGGLHLAVGTVPGLLYAWARCTDGAWLGLAGFAIPTGNGRGRVETRQWCPARALTLSNRPR
ncbi:hypothetical protein [Nocardia sp. NPDC051832]|uniref:hypothetical protein n=1 Tax=Nocardia sp. NPDC051832 TaxID=3155673 RepID=UPI0034239AFF